MLPIYQDDGFTFRFAEARLIPRFHLQGVEGGRSVSVFQIDPATGKKLRLLATATAGQDGWVDLTEPIIMRAGEAFVAVPAPATLETTPAIRLRRIQERLRPLKAALLDHPIYQEIDRLEALHTFMEHHVFAVWDFMSLLKALQQRLCCVAVPWLPAADPLGSRLVNAIVLAEESDDDGRGGFSSHFELYHRAMTRCGANVVAIDDFLGGCP